MRIDRREQLEKYETTNLEFYYGSRLHEPVMVWTIDFEKVKMYLPSLSYFRPSSHPTSRLASLTHALCPTYPEPVEGCPLRYVVISKSLLE